MNFSGILRVALVAATFPLLAYKAQAQGFYAKIEGGYNLPIGTHRGSNSTVTPSPNTSIYGAHEVEKVNINYGKGFIGNAAIGYMFSRNLGIELEAGYLPGETNKTFRKEDHNAPFASPFGGINYFYHSTSSSKAEMVLLQPAMVINTGLTEKLSLYGKFGVVVAKGNINFNHNIRDTYSERKIEEEYRGGLGFGLQGAMGLSFKISDKFDVFSEIKGSNLTYTPNNYHRIQEELNGEDITPTHSVNLTETYTTVNGQPNVGLNEDFIMSHIGLNLGVKLNF